jgi:hypothetical protein
LLDFFAIYKRLPVSAKLLMIAGNLRFLDRVSSVWNADPVSAVLIDNGYFVQIPTDDTAVYGERYPRVWHVRGGQGEGLLGHWHHAGD